MKEESESGRSGGGSNGNVEVAGEIQRGLRGAGRSGRSYDDDCDQDEAGNQLVWGVMLTERFSAHSSN